MNDYAELRAALEQKYNAIFIEDVDVIRALLAERDAFLGHVAELIAICEPNLYPCPDKPDSKWAKLMAAKAALAQEQEES